MEGKNKGGNTLLTAVVGAAVGAGAVLLADKKTRTTLKKKLNEWMEEVEGIKDKVEDVKTQGKARIEDEIKKTKTKIKNAVE